MVCGKNTYSRERLLLGFYCQLFSYFIESQLVSGTILSNFISIILKMFYLFLLHKNKNGEKHFIFETTFISICTNLVRYLTSSFFSYDFSVLYITPELSITTSQSESFDSYLLHVIHLGIQFLIKYWHSQDDSYTREKSINRISWWGQKVSFVVWSITPNTWNKNDCIKNE